MGDEGVKIIRPFLQRADEISKKFPKIAYYCRLHAVEEGIRLPQRSEELMSLVKNVMGQLEKGKPKLELSDKKADHEVCEAFAVQVFNRADEADRAGKADLSTARSFYAAYLFLDVLNHFSPIDEDLAAKQKYAVWKAADIRKALKEGRRPVAGSPADIKILLRPGAKVLFAAEPTDKPVQGTVAKIELIDGEQVYTVALADTFVQAPMSCLALEVSAGDQVIYTGAGSDMPATVQAMDMQHWPPSYVLALEDGSVRDTGPEYICLPSPASREAPVSLSSADKSPGCHDPSPRSPLTDACGPAHPTVMQGGIREESVGALGPTQAPVRPSHGTSQNGKQKNSGIKFLLSYRQSHDELGQSQTEDHSCTVPVTDVKFHGATTSTSQAPQATSGFIPDIARVIAAKKHAKSAASSLDFDDVTTSVKLIKEALRLLTDQSFS